MDTNGGTAARNPDGLRGHEPHDPSAMLHLPLVNVHSLEDRLIPIRPDHPAYRLDVPFGSVGVDHALQDKDVADVDLFAKGSDEMAIAQTEVVLPVVEVVAEVLLGALRKIASKSTLPSPLAICQKATGASFR